MGVRNWLRPPRHVLATFVAVGVVSAAALAWLMGTLLEQDKTVERQGQRDYLEQAADRAVAALQGALSDLELQLGASFDGRDGLDRLSGFSEGVIAVRIGSGGIAVRSEHAPVFYPEPRRGVEASPGSFVEIEEYSPKGLPLAAENYSRLAASSDKAVRAGALLRLARVQRKMQKPDAAIRTYNDLSKIGDATVAELPAELVARVGRASVYEESRRISELQAEAAALDSDLRRGQWQLTRNQYENYSRQAREWLGEVEGSADVDAVALAEAVAWLWDNRHTRIVASRRPIEAEGRPWLMVPRATPDGFVAALAAPAYLASLCEDAISESGMHCTFRDDQDREIVGRTPPDTMNAIRAAATTRLPWTIQVFPAAGAVPAGVSPRRSYLMGVAMVLTLVWIAGAAFIVRSIGRETRVAQLQSDFVAAVSHEFRSPLSSLCQISEMLSSDRLNSEDRRRDAYGVLARESERLRRLVEGLLDFQRFEASAAVFHFESIEIEAFLKSVVADFQKSIAASAYTIELGGDLAEHYIRADREALTRAMWNLLDNAVKYSPDCKTVWVDVEQNGDRVTIAVRDRGLGIPLTEQREIFKKFVRGSDSKTRRIKGTGIGLTMVRHIVEAHGGEISLASQPGEGSRFMMVFPVKAES